MEQWRAIQNYEISSEGRVRNKSSNTLLKPLKLTDGRYYHHIKGRNIYVHQLVWRAFNGREPEGFEIDHINRNKRDNRLSNLRLLTHQENGMNRGKQKNNTSGYKGVYAHGNNWRARLKVDGHIYNLGTFETKEEAAEAYNTYVKELYPDV